MGESLFKNLVNEIVDTVQDLFIAAIAAILLIFMAGEFYGSALGSTGNPAFWYPAWALGIVLAYKLLKDMFRKEKKK